MEIRIDRETVKQAFAEYVQTYDESDEKIMLKIRHTYRVAQIAAQIAQGMGLSEYDTDLAWLIGMLHDIGRFEQLRRYHTFVDADSIDHAHFGVELLFEEGLLGRFLQYTENCGNGISESVSMEKSENDESDSKYLPNGAERDFTFSWSEENTGQRDIQVLRKAIWNHSAFRVEKGLSQREILFAQIIRDADKIDILKVASDVPLETIYDVTTEQLHASPVTEEVMEQFRNEQAIIRSTKRVPVDYLVGHIALVFELEFPESYRIVARQGYLEKLLTFATPNPCIREQFQELRRRMKDFLERQRDETQKNG